MASIKAAKAREELADILNRAEFSRERVILSRRGKKVAAVVPIEDFELLEELEDRFDLEDAREALREAKSGDTIPWEKIKKELDL